jgi:hypothetical protein
VMRCAERWLLTEPPHKKYSGSLSDSSPVAASTSRSALNCHPADRPLDHLNLISAEPIMNTRHATFLVCLFTLRRDP